MKISKHSKILMEYLIENPCIPQPAPQTRKTEQIFTKFFHEIKEAVGYLEARKKKEGNFYKLRVSKIATIYQIPKPSQFNANSFPSEVRQHIDEHSQYDLSFTFSLGSREITIHFIVEDPDVELYIDQYSTYVDKIFVWLYFVDRYATKQCAKKLTVYLYMTSLTKTLPESSVHILDQIHVNTAFTYTCPIISEIVIFRKEEWFKVLLHETFHNFALDFSDMDTHTCHKKILSIFQVDSEVNLFEAYTEFWAEILNVAFCSFFLLKHATIDEFLQGCDVFVNLERTYSFFQLAKALQFMGLRYKDLYLPGSHVERKTLYKENSNILSYYVIKTILLSNYQGFLTWCNTNNLSLIQFKKTTQNLDEFCKFIQQNFKTASMLRGVNCAEKMVAMVGTKSKKSRTSKKLQFLMDNMRMTVCEMV